MKTPRCCEATVDFTYSTIKKRKALVQPLLCCFVSMKASSNIRVYLKTLDRWLMCSKSKVPAGGTLRRDLGDLSCRGEGWVATTLQPEVTAAGRSPAVERWVLGFWHEMQQLLTAILLISPLSSSWNMQFSKTHHWFCSYSPYSCPITCRACFTAGRRWTWTAPQPLGKGSPGQRYPVARAKLKGTWSAATAGSNKRPHVPAPGHSV